MTKLAKFLVLLYLVVSLSNTCSLLCQGAGAGGGGGDEPPGGVPRLPGLHPPQLPLLLPGEDRHRHRQEEPRLARPLRALHGAGHRQRVQQRRP